MLTMGFNSFARVEASVEVNFALSSFVSPYTAKFLINTSWKKKKKKNPKRKSPKNPKWTR